MSTIVIVPGLGGSGPAHWQTRWQQLYPRTVRVAQRDWDAPLCSEWCEALEQAVSTAAGQVVLVAHSLGSVLVAHWAGQASTRSLGKVRGALLVAPPDVESPERAPEQIRNFAPIPRARLPFASIVVGSRDDAYACIDCPRELATLWGARFVDVGARGHINAESNLGDWEEGRALLDELL